MLEIGKAIRIVREAKRMRLTALAERSGVSVPFLSLVENGDRQPSLAVLRKVADSLGIPSEVLVLLSQPAGGCLHSADQVSQGLVTTIEKLMDVENELRSKLTSEVKPRASRKARRR